jgi:chemotaxis protein MotB
MTLLLGLFIILYAISNIDLEKYENMSATMGNIFGSKADIVGIEKTGNIFNMEPITELKDKVVQLVDEFDYENSIKVEENERGVVIRILDDILFGSGSSELGYESRNVLQQIASIIRNVPNDIRIEGHTDNIPISTNQYPSNWHLSVNRALSTAYYLINTEKITPDKVSIVGYSEYQPVESNESPDGRALNRRVDIVIIKE